MAEHLFDLPIFSLHYEVKLYYEFKTVLKHPKTTVVLSKKEIKGFLDSTELLYSDFSRLIKWMESEGFVKILSRDDSVNLKFTSSGRIYLRKIEERISRKTTELL